MYKYVTIDKETAIVKPGQYYDLNECPFVSVEVQEALQHGCTHVHYDFSSTTFIDSAATKKMIQIYRKLGMKNLSISNTSSVVRDALKGAGILRMLEVNGQLQNSKI